MTPNEFAVKVPFSVFVSGPSQSGSLNVEKGVLSKPVRKIVYAYSKVSRNFQGMRDKDAMTFNDGLPTKEELTEWTKDGEDLLLVLDDLVYRLIQSFDYMELFSIYVHHLKVSVIFISQNLFPQGKYSRVISLNCQYLVLFKNPRDNFHFRYLAT